MALLAGAQDESKHIEKKKPEVAKVDVKVRVSSKDGKPVPAGSKVEIAGKEALCGDLYLNDVMAIIDDKGEVVFHGIPACKVLVKLALTEFMPLTQTADLTNYKSCEAPGRGRGAAACEPVLLELVRLH